MFSIIIPTWNNLEFLKLAINSIRKNSKYNHQILVHVNDGSDGSLDWLKQQIIEDRNILFTHSSDNIGICYAVNRASSLANQKYIIYLNDDMAVLPNWDTNMLEVAEQLYLSGKMFMLSGTMIEPRESKNACIVKENYGTNPQNFDEKKLIDNIDKHKRADWLGSTWPPTLVPTWLWNEVGGYSTEFSPGMSSDNDFSMKLWHAGCRIFAGLGNSLVYHFGCVSTNRIVKNNGRKQFLYKWGITQKDFDTICLQRGLEKTRQEVVKELILTKKQIKLLKFAKIKAKIRILFKN
ncbi:MAG: hypothetical protein RLZZ210_1569 [Pseudomonadota bacterium]|jgi:GT2 family glycosyltransferase